MSMRLTLGLLGCLVWTVGYADPKGVDFRGYYVGDFEASQMKNDKDPSYRNKINVSIDSVVGSKITGHSVVAGNSRPFVGTIRERVVTAKEPGDDPYDGVFEFTLQPKGTRIDGSWTANDKKLAVTKRKYTLHKTAFRYDPHQKLDGIGRGWVYSPGLEGSGRGEKLTADAYKFNASDTVLQSRDVENMYKRDLEVTRNAIYARHGYSFQNRDMRYFFDRVSWYVPVSTDVTAQLTDLEKRNIELLKRYENHAASYYDRFGR